MTRRVIAGLIVVGLGVGVWVLWPRNGPNTTPTTEAVAIEDESPTRLSTTSTVLANTSTAGVATTSGAHVVTSVEEAEEILRELWFGWFEGIYNQDEDRIKEVVGSQQMLDAAREAFGAEFESEPVLESLISDLEILFADRGCLVAWSLVDASRFRGIGAVTATVTVARRDDSRWLLLSTWVHKEDLWASDCDAHLEPLL